MKNILLAISLLLLLLFQIKAIGLPRTIELKAINTIVLSDEITKLTVFKDIGNLIGSRQLLNYGMGKQEILYIVIPSAGGDVDAGKFLLDTINNMPNTEIICRYCNSEAGFIFMNSKLKKLVAPNSTILMHEMKIIATADELSPLFIKEFKEDSKEFDTIISKKLKISLEEYEKLIKNKDYILEGSDIVEKGLADELVNIKCDDRIKEILPKTCTLK